MKIPSVRRRNKNTKPGVEVIWTCVVLATLASLANADVCNDKCGPDEACDTNTGHCLICETDICIKDRFDWPDACKKQCPDYYNKHYGPKPSVDDPDGVNKWKITAIVVIPVMGVVIMVMAGVIVWLCKNRRDGRRTDREEVRDDPDAIPLVQVNGVGPTTQLQGSFHHSGEERATVRGAIAQTGFYGNDGEAATALLRTRDVDRSDVAPQASLATSENLSRGSILNSDRHRNGSAARNRESPLATGGVRGHSAVTVSGTVSGTSRPAQGGPALGRLQPQQTRRSPVPNSNSSPACFDAVSQAPPRRGAGATEDRADADSPSETSDGLGCESSGLRMPASSSSQTYLKTLSPTDPLPQERRPTPAGSFDDSTASPIARPVCHPEGENDGNANPNPTFLRA